MHECLEMYRIIINRHQGCICQISTRGVGWVRGPKGRRSRPERRAESEGGVLGEGQQAPSPPARESGVSFPGGVWGSGKISNLVHLGTWKSHQDSVKWCRLHSVFTQTQWIPLLSSSNIGSKGVKGVSVNPPERFSRYDCGSATSWRGWTPTPPPAPQIQPW